MVIKIMQYDVRMCQFRPSVAELNRTLRDGYEKNQLLVYAFGLFLDVEQMLHGK